MGEFTDPADQARADALKAGSSVEEADAAAAAVSGEAPADETPVSDVEAPVADDVVDGGVADDTTPSEDVSEEVSDETAPEVTEE